MCGEPAGGAAGDVLAELVAVEPDLAGVVVAVDTEQREDVVLGGEALHEEQSGSGVEADGTRGDRPREFGKLCRLCRFCHYYASDENVTPMN